MRLLFVTPRLPFLPCHDAARLAVSRLLDHLVDRHTVAVVAATAAGDTPAQRAWLSERACSSRVSATSCAAMTASARRSSGTCARLVVCHPA
jgi:hypothetical protein